MGMRVAPAYANIFMGAFEDIYITGEFSDNILVYKRFIDDLFIIWRGDEGSALNFVEKINKNDWGVTLTPKFNQQNIDLLDLIISQDLKSFHTATYFKSVDTNSYIEFNFHLR